ILGIADVEISNRIKRNLRRVVQLSRCRKTSVSTDSTHAVTSNDNELVSTRRDFKYARFGGICDVKLATLIHCHTREGCRPGEGIGAGISMDHAVFGYFEDPRRTLNKVQVAERIHGDARRSVEWG